MDKRYGRRARLWFGYLCNEHQHHGHDLCSTGNKRNHCCTDWGAHVQGATYVIQDVRGHNGCGRHYNYEFNIVMIRLTFTQRLKRTHNATPSAVV